MSEAFELGLALFKREPELLLIEVYRRAEIEVDRHDFIAGYMKGRRQRDEYEAEKKEQEKENDPHSPE